MSRDICIFDAYGTLFDVAGAARRASEEPGQGKLADIWPSLAEDWRRKQLEYSWLRAVTGHYVSFWQITQDGLDWALDKAGIADDALRARLLDLYRDLPAYPEVPDVLAGLKRQGKACAILSNGSPDMLGSAVESAGIGAHLDAVLSVADIRTFKPSRAVYDMVGARFGCRPEQVLFVSSNGWDIAGAAAYGFHAVWVNRAGAPRDRLMGQPAAELNDLTTIADHA